ncbi:MAG TPA: serine/threonine protein kinase, partial [Polyangiaceae bacterium]|nr:serine/threonine protein kinase [Polyangiaceae bacterium]
MIVSGCPDAHELLRALDGAGEPETEAHVRDCAECRLAMAAFARTGSVTDGGTLEVEEALAWIEDVQRRLKTSLSPGDRLGRYEIRACAGIGGMGVVYEAYDPELDRRIALKVLRPHHRGEGSRRLSREARALAKLSHPNVVSVFDVGSEGDRVFIAMELIDGSTLREWLDEVRSRAEVLEAFIEAGRGLAAAHERGLVHRDFKPDNVLVGEDGRVVVTDFGLARHRFVSDTDDVTRDGAIVGTPAYMAPEVRSGGDVDARSDQFSFAVALYQALHGHLPRVDLPLMQGARSAQLGWRLRRVLRRALDGDPSKRFRTMDALVEELERCRAPRRGPAILAVAATVGSLAVAATSTDDTTSAHLSPTWTTIASPNAPP